MAKKTGLTKAGVAAVAKTKREAFLRNLEETGLSLKSARLAGAQLRALQRYKETDPEFRDAWSDALAGFRESLEQELYRRAVEGVLEPVFYKGVQIGTIRRFSDKLLEMLVKANDPRKYGRQQIDVDVRGGVMMLHAPAMTADQWVETHTIEPPEDTE